MTNHKKTYRPVQGKTYTLFAAGEDTEGYYADIKALADFFLEVYPGEADLLRLIQQAEKKRFLKGFKAVSAHKPALDLIRERLKQALSRYTLAVAGHLQGLSLTEKLDATLATAEEQYHFYMLEIEIVNRINRQKFKEAEFKFALMAHCLRDFRTACRSVAGDFEAVCRGCTEDCLVHLGSLLLEKYAINPYISVEMEQEKLFRKLKREHPSIGALGIACVPELAQGMRLCLKNGIPAVGIPLDANRCARWLSQAQETSFNLEQLEELIR